MKCERTTALRKAWRQLPVGGLIAQGTLVERWYDRTVNNRTRRYGPYYCWTRKVEGKTKTLALSQVQARKLRAALATQRRVQSILALLHAESEQIINRSMPGVVRRNRLPRK